MLSKKQHNKSTIKNRVSAVCLLALFCALATFSVYADNTKNMTAAQSGSVTADTLLAEYEAPVTVMELNTSSEDTLTSLTNTTLIAEPVTPLVQALSLQAANIASLESEANGQADAVASFFEHSVFVGDSISVGFSNYCSSHSSIATDTTYFLAKESGSAHAAVSSYALTQYANVMPVYQGKVQYIEDSIAQMTDVEKVFICYGVNDLVSSTPQQYLADMQTLIERILAKSPQVTVYCISIPCVVDTVSTGLLNNASIQEANLLLQEACTQNGWGFINLSEYLMNDTLSIRAEYSSDGYVHQNSAAYEIWNKVFTYYAYKEMTS